VLQKICTMISDCNRKLTDEYVDRAAIADSIKSTVKLMNKSVGITQKYLIEVPKTVCKTPAKIEYICSKCDATSDQPGKCAQCGASLEKKIDRTLKVADKLIREVKPADANTLMTCCEAMLQEASAKVQSCNKMLAGEAPVMAEIAQSAKESIDLLNKSTEVAERYLPLAREIPKSKKPADGKAITTASTK
jgi:hypothetical protein